MFSFSLADRKKCHEKGKEKRDLTVKVHLGEGRNDGGAAERGGEREGGT